MLIEVLFQCDPDFLIHDYKCRASRLSVLSYTSDVGIMDLGQDTCFPQKQREPFLEGFRFASSGPHGIVALLPARQITRHVFLQPDTFVRIADPGAINHAVAVYIHNFNDRIVADPGVGL